MHSIPRRFALFALMGAALLLIPAVHAQSFTASLLGDVTDFTGAAIPSVTIVAVNVATNQRIETRSDATGRYAVSPLQPGSYTLEATAPGFKKFVQTRVELAGGQQAKLDISMTIGEITENVTVEANAAAIETATSTI